MRRREFIAGLGSATAWPLAARAQQGERLRRIGVLSAGVETAFREQLRMLNYNAKRPTTSGHSS